MNHEVRDECWHASWLGMGAHVASADARALRNCKVSLDDPYYLTLDGGFCTPQWATIEGVEQPGEKDDESDGCDESDGIPPDPALP